MICLYIRICMYTCIQWRVYTFVYLCVHFCSGREFGISQHRLGNAVETTALFFKTMITSCSASAASQNLPPLSKRAVCVQMHSCVRMCTRTYGVYAHLCCLSVYKEKHTLCCLLIVVQGFPSFTCDYGKSHSLSHQRQNTEPRLNCTAFA